MGTLIKAKKLLRRSHCGCWRGRRRDFLSRNARDQFFGLLARAGIEPGGLQRSQSVKITTAGGGSAEYIQVIG
jgi:hypothetical protein